MSDSNEVQVPEPQKVVVIDKSAVVATRKAKEELAQIQSKAKDGDMTPDDWEKIKHLQAQIAIAEKEHQEAESEQSSG